MKFDMHCHTQEGSIDCSVPVEEYICRLKKHGFGGMLITDHNSYNGYRAWRDTIKGKKHTDFTVLKGIEYDTLDGGHILVILPETQKLLLMELRGLPVHLLADIVHRHGGILGPAHPFGEPYLSFMNSMKPKRRKEILRLFDFVEIYNACEDAQANKNAQKLAQRLKKPGFGGSDSHKAACVGKGYAELPDTIKTESDLIQYVKSCPEIICGGSFYTQTLKDRIGRANDLLVFSYYFYNRICALAKRNKRRAETMKVIIQKGIEHMHHTKDN